MGVGVNGLLVILFGYGIVNFVGMLFVGCVFEYWLWLMLIGMLVLMVVFGIVFVVFGCVLMIDVVLVVLWGMVFGGVLVVWLMWVMCIVFDEVESVGGLIVVVI